MTCLMHALSHANIVVTYLHGNNNPNVFTTVWYIMYLYNIKQAYQYYILPYRAPVSLPRKCVYGNIQVYTPRVYHIIHFYHYRADVRTVNIGL